jgi:hypothetical protein
LARDLMHGLVGEPEELDFRHRHHARGSKTNRRARNHRFGDRGVDHPAGAEGGVQPVGGAKHTAVDANVLAEHNHPLVASHFLVQGVVDGLEHCHELGVAHRTSPAR